MTTAALIQAKGTSRRVPGKNLRYMAGRRLLEWAIKAAVDSGCIDEIYVSSESDEVKQVANSCGAIFIRRPDILATSTAGGGVTKVHALKEIYKWARYDYMFDLWCTSPMIQGWQLADAFQQFQKARYAKALSSVTAVKSSIVSNTYVIDPKNNAIMNVAGIMGPPVYYDQLKMVFTNGAFGIFDPNIVDYDKLPVVTANMDYNDIDWAYAEAVNEFHVVETLGNRHCVYGYEIDQISAIHIDTEEDFAIAEYFMNERISKHGKH